MKSSQVSAILYNSQWIEKNLLGLNTLLINYKSHSLQIFKDFFGKNRLLMNFPEIPNGIYTSLTVFTDESESFQIFKDLFLSKKGAFTNFSKSQWRFYKSQFCMLSLTVFELTEIYFWQKPSPNKFFIDFLWVANSEYCIRFLIRLQNLQKMYKQTKCQHGVQVVNPGRVRRIAKSVDNTYLVSKVKQSIGIGLFESLVLNIALDFNQSST